MSQPRGSLILTEIFLLRDVKCGFHARSRSGDRIQRGRLWGVLGKAAVPPPRPTSSPPRSLPGSLFSCLMKQLPLFLAPASGGCSPRKGPRRAGPWSSGSTHRSTHRSCPQELPGETKQSAVSLEFSAPVSLSVPSTLRSRALTFTLI